MRSAPRQPSPPSPPVAPLPPPPRAAPLNLDAARLEDWMRRYYFDTPVDLGSSGVECYALGELREALRLDIGMLDAIVLQDSRTLGAPALRAAIAARYDTGDPERVMATHGSNEALFMVMHRLLTPGDQVVVVDPAYQQLSQHAASLGCTLTRWTLREEDGFVPDLEAARRAIRPGTRLVVVNFPHNPTGASLDLAGRDELVRIARAAGAWLVWDAAFVDLVYGEGPRQPLTTERYERLIQIGTLSKAYGLPGLRVGWCIGAPDLLEGCNRIKDYTTLHLSPLIETIAEAAIRSADRLIGPRLAQARHNLALLRAWAEPMGDEIDLAPPLGGVCVFPAMRRVPDVEAWCRRLGDDGLLLVPGSCFDRPGRVRLGFGASSGTFASGLAHLTRALRAC